MGFWIRPLNGYKAEFLEMHSKGVGAGGGTAMQECLCLDGALGVGFTVRASRRDGGPPIWMARHAGLLNRFQAKQIIHLE